MTALVRVQNSRKIKIKTFSMEKKGLKTHLNSYAVNLSQKPDPNPPLKTNVLSGGSDNL